jgi:hypothetical protein
MNLGQSINTYNPTIELLRETGTFKVTTPSGEKIYVACEPGGYPTVIQWSDADNRKPFLLTKMSEPVSGSGTEHITPFVRQAATG